jgi:hypothetical protein
MSVYKRSAAIGEDEQLTTIGYILEICGPSFLVKRWRILIKVIPFVGVGCLVRWLLWNDGKYSGNLETTILPPMITACVFVAASMLSNVVSDFKESEKIPAEMVGYFQTLTSFARVAANHFKDGKSSGEGHHAEVKVGDAYKQIEVMLLAVIDFLDHRGTYQLCIESFQDAEVAYLSLLAHWGEEHMETPEHVLTELRKKICRVHDISRTHIILPLYSLIDALTIALIAFIVTIKFTYENTAYAAIATFGGLFLYLNFLNRDLDDPFIYKLNYHLKCYLRGSRKELKIKGVWLHPPSIDFDCLTIDYGSTLRKLMANEGLVPSRPFPSKPGMSMTTSSVDLQTKE